MKKFKIDIFKLCKGYEDEDHPCYNCFVKGVCSNSCQGIWEYEKDLKKIATDIGRKLIPNKSLARKILHIAHKQSDYSIRDMMDYFKAIEGKQVEDLLINEGVVTFIKRAQYTTNRQGFILKNYMMRNPNAGMGSTSSSSVSSSAISSTPSNIMSFNGNKGMANYFKPPKKLNQNLVRRHV
ncbi:MAG: hypothetical protein KGD64_02115 [Candidatus Heimdallarchaeota archaeon]|nr:hypothetical protein [Candidatus Heimdallarchaeota archaeon]